MLARCGSQLRVGGMGVPFALDFGAVMMMALSLGADAELVADALPEVEGVVLDALRGEGGD